MFFFNFRMYSSIHSVRDLIFSDATCVSLFLLSKVLYLDKLDFGVRAVENGAPRILAWKGNLIKHFSELDRKKRNLFGRRPFKKEVCYIFSASVLLVKKSVSKREVARHMHSFLFCSGVIISYFFFFLFCTHQS